MPKSVTTRRPIRSAAFAAVALSLALGLGGCAGVGDFSSTRTQGYAIPDDALAQIRPGQSQELVRVVLGSPETQNTFADESAWYYVETKISETAFGMTSVQSRRVLAVYFDKNSKVKDKALYTLKDGKVFAIETRRTPSFGQDKTFVESILNSVGI
ncbi:MAG TPA: outer membrane protein assembly factor BamE [Devosiaceae bacterium]